LRKGLAVLIREGLLESVPGAGNRVVKKEGSPAAVRTIGCLMLRRAGRPMVNPYFASIFEGIEQTVSAHDYTLVFSSVRDSELWLANGDPRPSPDAATKEYAGVILIGGLPDTLALAFERRGVSTVFVDRIPDDRSLSNVVPDNVAGARKAAMYLLKLGHRRIAFVGGPDDPVRSARLKGLTTALDQAGCTFDSKDLIVGDYQVSVAQEAVAAYLRTQSGNLPTALMAINDEAAIGAIKALQEAGLRVPEDMSVVGFDDIDWAAHTHPPLTTVRIERAEMGRAAARTLFSRIDAHSSGPAHITLDTELIERESCAPAE
jgi:DNA-binding LacI/PurR family transcriptional regulator